MQLHLCTLTQLQPHRHTQNDTSPSLLPLPSHNVSSPLVSPADRNSSLTSWLARCTASAGRPSSAPSTPHPCTTWCSTAAPSKEAKPGNALNSELRSLVWFNNRISSLSRYFQYRLPVSPKSESIQMSGVNKTHHLPPKASSQVHFCGRNGLRHAVVSCSAPTLSLPCRAGHLFVIGGSSSHICHTHCCWGVKTCEVTMHQLTHASERTSLHGCNKCTLSVLSP